MRELNADPALFPIQTCLSWASLKETQVLPKHLMMSSTGLQLVNRGRGVSPFLTIWELLIGFLWPDYCLLSGPLRILRTGSVCARSSEVNFGVFTAHTKALTVQFLLISASKSQWCARPHCNTMPMFFSRKARPAPAFRYRQLLSYQILTRYTFSRQGHQVRVYYSCVPVSCPSYRTSSVPVSLLVKAS